MPNSQLPKDPFILYSFLNTMLRDKYSSLEELCRDYGVNEADLKKEMLKTGFVYEPSINQFR